MKTRISLFFCLFTCLVVSAQTQPNIIFVMIDDLNDFVEGFGGHPQTITPNIAELESKGTTFVNSYCTAPQCGPSRLSLLSGKDLAYTQVYDNSEYICNAFSDHFKPAYGNAEYFTLPGYLKDSAGYFTLGLNKIFHCYDDFPEYDSVTSDPCAKNLSWNKVLYHSDSAATVPLTLLYDDGLAPFRWGKFDSLEEPLLMDYVITDSAINWLNAYAADPSIACDKPFFMGIGYRKPHFPSFVPEQYFSPYYLEDFYGTDFDIPYNYPEGSTPYNGIILNQEDEPRFADIQTLGEAALALASTGSDNRFVAFGDTSSYLPFIDSSLADAGRRIIMEKSKRANSTISYLASIRFMDTQFGRLMDGLEAHPEIYNNTVIVLMSDHGFQLGEKQHWQKQTLWEETVRTPLIIADLRTPIPRVSTRMVSFLDIFPTVCDYAGVTYPLFSDGSEYLDGISIKSLVDSYQPQNERPVLSAIKNSQLKEASCYPHYSVRNNRWHFIHYNPDNAIGEHGCDSSAAPLEEELYEIGVNRDIDPNEFNNLAYNPAYEKLINYLRSFMPGNENYLQVPLRAEVRFRGGILCFYDNDDQIKLRLNLFDENGLALPNAAYAGYTITWSANIDTVTYSGRNLNFSMLSVPSATYDTLDRIFFNCEVKDATGKLVAFELKYVYVNPANTPIVTYNTPIDGYEVSFTDYTISGSYNTTNWSFGDGSSYSATLVPGPHTYSTTGGKTIKNKVIYGNKNCTVSFDKAINITGRLGLTGDEEQDILLFPNPANTSVTVVCKAPANNVQITILNQLGVIVKSLHFDSITDMQRIDISDLVSGYYVFSFQTVDFKATSELMVLGK